MNLFEITSKYRSGQTKRLLLIILLLVLYSCSLPIQPPEKPVPCPSMTVYFSPKGGAEEAIVKELGIAKTAILLQAYSFTSAAIAKGLVAAHERGVKFEFILDKSNLTTQYTSGPYVAKAGILRR